MNQQGLTSLKGPRSARSSRASHYSQKGPQPAFQRNLGRSLATRPASAQILDQDPVLQECQGCIAGSVGWKRSDASGTRGSTLRPDSRGCVLRLQVCGKTSRRNPSWWDFGRDRLVAIPGESLRRWRSGRGGIGVGAEKLFPHVPATLASVIENPTDEGRIL